MVKRLVGRRDLQPSRLETDFSPIQHRPNEYTSLDQIRNISRSIQSKKKSNKNSYGRRGKGRTFPPSSNRKNGLNGADAFISLVVCDQVALVGNGNLIKADKYGAIKECSIFYPCARNH